MEDSSILAWVLAGVISVVGTLATTVTVLFKINEAKNTKAIESQSKRLAKQDEKIEKLEVKSDECERDRAELRVKVAKLEAEQGEII